MKPTIPDTAQVISTVYHVLPGEGLELLPGAAVTVPVHHLARLLALPGVSEVPITLSTKEA